MTSPLMAPVITAQADGLCDAQVSNSLSVARRVWNSFQDLIAGRLLACTGMMLHPCSRALRARPRGWRSFVDSFMHFAARLLTQTGSHPTDRRRGYLAVAPSILQPLADGSPRQDESPPDSYVRYLAPIQG